MVEVGEKFKRTDGPLTREMIKAYAKASGDTNPVHVDEEFATTRGGLNGVISHGMLYFGYLNHLICDLADKFNGKLQTVGIEMRGVVRPGDILISTAEIKSVENGVISLDVIQISKMPLKLEKDGQIVKTYEGEERNWVKEKERTGIRTEETDEGTFTFKEWAVINGTATIKLQ